MFKGFYNLTSGMLSQGRRLDVVANNMTNISTPGYKSDHYTDSTFDEALYVRIGNKNRLSDAEMGEINHILAPSQLYTDYTHGTYEETELSLDFAIQGEGFFAIQGADGGVSYTRSGSFILDNDRYLYLTNQGRVLDNQGNPIQLYTDHIKADKDGNLYSEEDGAYLGTLGVYAFEDNGELERNDQGLFVGDGAQLSQDFKIMHKWVERSNTDLISEMVKMMSAQRALQSAGQMLKIYDQVMNHATNDLGRM